MKKDAKIYVAGHGGLVGSAIVRALERDGYTRVITKPRSELDLCDYDAVDAFFRVHQPEYVFMAAARVGGIMANVNYPVEFLRENLDIETNVIGAAHKFDVSKLLFLGSSCIYPKQAEQPIIEDALLSGKLEPTNEAYAIAKIAGIILCQSYAKQYDRNFLSVMPTNLFGPHDNFDPETSHVAPALVEKMHRAKKEKAKSLELWGTGTPRRELLYVDDCADACVFLMQNYDNPEIINIGTGQDHTIKELAEMVAKIVGYKGDITFDSSKPDGMARKQLNVDKIHELGWKHTIPVEEGFTRTYDWFLQHSDYA